MPAAGRNLTVSCYHHVMHPPLKARVRDGRLVLDEPTNLPEGIEVELIFADGDDLDPDERRELEEALHEGLADIDAGRTVDAREFIAGLRART